MAVVRPQEGQTATSLLRKLVGKYVVLNVTTGGEETSVCVNIERSGSAAWRRKEKNKGFKLNLDWPGFSLTPGSLLLSYEDVNVLANNFHAVRDALPAKAVGPDGTAAIGTLPRDGDEMAHVLTGLEKRTSEIVAISSALELPLDTSLLTIRQQLGHSANLMTGGKPSTYGRSVLDAFIESQAIYAQLPELTGFGTDNERGQDRPGPRDALMRWYMQHNPTNPLGSSPAIEFVEYELKPLNISERLTWTCSCDARKHSIDLLLALDDAPVFTEVKMKGDKLASSAVVQLLYYASVVANGKQCSRLRREIRDFQSEKKWLSVVVEERASSDEPSYDSDLQKTLAFLKHDSTKSVLVPFFSGCIALVIREQSEPFCSARNMPEFRVIEGGQHFISFDGAGSVK